MWIKFGPQSDFADIRWSLKLPERADGIGRTASAKRARSEREKKQDGLQDQAQQLA